MPRAAHPDKGGGATGQAGRSCGDSRVPRAAALPRGCGAAKPLRTPARPPAGAASERSAGAAARPPARPPMRRRCGRGHAASAAAVRVLQRRKQPEMAGTVGPGPAEGQCWGRGRCRGATGWGAGPGARTTRNGESGEHGSRPHQVPGPSLLRPCAGFSSLPVASRRTFSQLSFLAWSRKEGFVMIIKLDFILQSFRQATSAVDQCVVLRLDSGKTKSPTGF